MSAAFDMNRRLRLGEKRNTVQKAAEQRECPVSARGNTRSPDGLRRFRYLNRSSWNGVGGKRVQQMTAI